MRGLALSAALLFSLGLFQSGVARAVEIKIQAQGNDDEADVGSRVMALSNSALIHVAITNLGVGVNSLGPYNGDGTSEVNLPTGWSFHALAAPPLGCGFTVTQFGGSSGIYVIRVVPYQNNPSCVWKAGEYDFYVKIDTASYQGLALGKLIVN